MFHKFKVLLTIFGLPIFIFAFLYSSISRLEVYFPKITSFLATLIFILLFWNRIRISLHVMYPNRGIRPSWIMKWRDICLLNIRDFYKKVYAYNIIVPRIEKGLNTTNTKILDEYYIKCFEDNILPNLHCKFFQKYFTNDFIQELKRMEKLNGMKRFLDQFPLTDFDSDYYDLIKNMLDDVEINDVISKGIPVRYGVTSSTSKSIDLKKQDAPLQKYVPVYDETIKRLSESIIYSHYNQTVNLYPDIDFEESPRIGMISYCTNESYSPILKLKRSPLSSILIEENSQKPFSMVSPYEVYRIPDHHSALFLHTFFLLQEKDLIVLSSTFLAIISEWFSKLLELSDEIIESIKIGNIPNHILDKVPKEHIEKLLENVYPNPQRAKELKKIFNDYKNHSHNGLLGLTIFPKLKLISAIATGQFSLYIPKVREFIGKEIDIHSVGVASSETGLISFANSRNNQDFFINLNGIIYEFIPLENVDLDNDDLIGDKKPLKIDEILIGETYEIVVTNYSFRRLRTGDLIKIINFRGIIPVFEFIGRRKTILNLRGEKVTETQLKLAIDSALKNIYHTSYEYCVIPNTNEAIPSYDIFIEISDFDGIMDINELRDEIDKRLCSTSEHYSSYRISGILGKLKVSLVKVGTFEKIEKLKIEYGASKNQVKNTLVVTKGSLNEKILFSNMIE